MLTGNYMGTPAEPVSVLAGIQAVVSAERRCTTPGLRDHRRLRGRDSRRPSRPPKIPSGGGGDGPFAAAGGRAGPAGRQPAGCHQLGDRMTLDLPAGPGGTPQGDLRRPGHPLILVLINGSAVSINWADEHIPAILEAWYPGQAGGTAVAEALFGLTNPGGRLPVTFYQSAADLPAFDDYSMENRTYRYFTGQPLYPFGFGLSYTTFAYRNLRIDPGGGRIPASPSPSRWKSKTPAAVAGDEVVQLYLKDVEASLPVPLLQLQGFTRIRLAPGEKQTVEFTLTPAQMSFADESGKWVLEPGEFQVWVGGRQPGFDPPTDWGNVYHNGLGTSHRKEPYSPPDVHCRRTYPLLRDFAVPSGNWEMSAWES